MQMDFNVINEQLFRLLDNEISDVDFTRLMDWLNSSKEAKIYYYQFMSDFGVLSLRKMTSIGDDLQECHFEFSETGVVDTKQVGDSNVSLRGVDLDEFMDEDSQADADDSDKTGDLLEILELERTSPAVEIPKEEAKHELIQKVDSNFKWFPGEGNKALTRAYLALAACIMVFIGYVYFFVPDPVDSVDVATVTDQMNIQWAQPGFQLKTGERLWTKDFLLNLKKGIISIEYDYGVEVTIEGPALFEVERLGVYLKYGRVYSKVSETGLGFIVRTPTSQFVDQGTEFGVLADINGSSELHVTKGKVQLFAGLKGKSRAMQMITENKAARFDADKGQIKSIEVQKKAFVRDFDSNTGFIWKGQTEIDLADIFGDGNGFGSGKTDVCLDVRSGKFTSLRGYEDGTQPPNNVDRFVYVTQSSYIDSVFLPDAGDGSVQVSSAGDVFDDCPDTSGWTNSYSIFNGDTLKLYKERWPILLDDKRYGTKNDPSITFSSNRGITFDLEAIRRTVPVVDIKRFTAKCGIVQRRDWFSEGDADIRVLVDGQERFKALGKTRSSEPSVIDIELNTNDRFLTLLVTDGKDKSTTGDWVVFAEPVLKLSEK